MRIERRHLLKLGGSAMAMLSAPAIGRAATRQLRLGHNNNTHSIVHSGATAFADAVASLSDHRFAVDVFPNGMIGDEWQTMKAVADGTLDASINIIGTTANYVKEISLVELPYLFPDITKARQCFDGPLGSECAAALKQKGIVVAGWGEIGLRHITANKVIRKPSDLAGVKLRVQMSEPNLQTFLAMGAAAETLPFTQLLEALRIGRFEAQENPFAIIIPSKIYTLQKTLSLTGHVYTPSLLVLSGDLMDEMTPADREIMIKAGAIGAKAMRDFSDRIADGSPDFLRSAGMTVVEVDRSAFRDASQIANVALRKTFGSNALGRIRDLAAS